MSRDRQTAGSGEGGRDSTTPPTPTVVPVDFRNVGNNIGEEDQDGANEYVVDIDTHQSFFVRASTPETAIARAVLHTIDPEENGEVTEVGRDVHTCVHSGIDDEEHEGHKEHE